MVMEFLDMMVQLCMRAISKMVSRVAVVLVHTYRYGLTYAGRMTSKEGVYNGNWSND